MGMKEKYAADAARYKITDDLIKKGKLGEVWKLHPDTGTGTKKAKHINRPKPHDLDKPKIG